jgi:hypothetical protein
VRSDFIDEHDLQLCPIVSVAAHKRNFNLHTTTVISKSYKECVLQQMSITRAWATAGADHMLYVVTIIEIPSLDWLGCFFFKSSTMMLLIHSSRQLTRGRAGATR